MAALRLAIHHPPPAMSLACASQRPHALCAVSHGRAGSLVPPLSSPVARLWPLVSRLSAHLGTRALPCAVFPRKNWPNAPPSQRADPARSTAFHGAPLLTNGRPGRRRADDQRRARRHRWTASRCCDGDGAVGAAGAGGGGFCRVSPTAADRCIAASPVVVGADDVDSGPANGVARGAYLERPSLRGVAIPRF